jgi:hypothetical protein
MNSICRSPARNTQALHQHTFLPRHAAATWLRNIQPTTGSSRSRCAAVGSRKIRRSGKMAAIATTLVALACLGCTPSSELRGLMRSDAVELEVTASVDTGADAAGNPNTQTGDSGTRDTTLGPEEAGASPDTDSAEAGPGTTDSPGGGDAPFIDAGTGASDLSPCACEECGTGQSCSVQVDCGTVDCDGGIGATPDCNNGILDGMESDVDCGTAACGLCAAGDACASDANCSSGVCNLSDGRCDAPSCDDGVQNGAEADVDCGQACSANAGGLCATGQSCSDGVDCDSGVCDQTLGSCSAPSCSDGVSNASETDVDCGGTCATNSDLRCNDNAGCDADNDCQSGNCSGPGGYCLAIGCDDGIKNGAETAVDCGGPECDPCGQGESCNSGSDCSAGSCINGLCCGNDQNCPSCAQENCQPDWPCSDANVSQKCTPILSCYASMGFNSYDEAWSGGQDPCNIGGQGGPQGTGSTQAQAIVEECGQCNQ